jgi:hypothetical protein
MTSEEFELFLKDLNLKNGYNNKPITRNFFSVSDGWLSLIKDLILELKNVGWNGEVVQVKEKFGGLRFYIPSETTVESAIIRKYELQSLNICEVCGKNGKSKEKNNWLKTVCDEHWEN